MSLTNTQSSQSIFLKHTGSFQTFCNNLSKSSQLHLLCMNHEDAWQRPFSICEIMWRKQGEGWLRFIILKLFTQAQSKGYETIISMFPGQIKQNWQSSVCSDCQCLSHMQPLPTCWECTRPQRAPQPARSPTGAMLLGTKRWHTPLGVRTPCKCRNTLAPGRTATHTHTEFISSYEWTHTELSGTDEHCNIFKV